MIKAEYDQPGLDEAIEVVAHIGPAIKGILTLRDVMLLGKPLRDDLRLKYASNIIVDFILPYLPKYVTGISLSGIGLSEDLSKITVAREGVQPVVAEKFRQVWTLQRLEQYVQSLAQSKGLVYERIFPVTH